MFKDMITTIKAKYVEMFLFLCMYVGGNTVYFGYFRPSDVLNGIVYTLLLYVVWGYFMRNFGQYSPFMTQRNSYTWTLGQSIEDNKWMFGWIICVFTVLWYLNFIDFSIPMYIFFMLYMIPLALLMDKARYLENETVQ